MTTEELIRYFPVLYHMANAGTWPSIRGRGLLSTSALLDLFEIHGQERERIESQHRPSSIEIRHPEHGSVVIRDQAPMREAALRNCLRGMTVRQWYEMLNRKTFFWVTESRVTTLLGARLYRDREHVVIAVDCAGLVKAHSGSIRLSPINSGSTIYNPQPRGPETFRTIAEYPFDERRKLRGNANAVAELTVDYAVTDLFQHTLRVERRRGTQIVETLYLN